MNLYDAGGNIVCTVKGKFLSLRGTYTLHPHGVPHSNSEGKTVYTTYDVLNRGRKRKRNLQLEE